MLEIRLALIDWSRRDENICCLTAGLFDFRN